MPSAIGEILTTEATLAEVQEYAGQLARKRRLSVDVVLLVSSLAEARKRIGRRDPDDVELLALAIQLKVPVWSNDNDFENTGVVWHTTASLLAALR